MSLARRVRAGIALHAGVNVAFALGAVLSAAGGPAAVAADGPLGPLATGAPSGLPIHSVTTMPVHPLLVGPPATATTVATATSTAPATTAAAPRAATGAAATPATTAAAAGRQATATAARSTRSDLPIGTARQVSSTGYCLTGITASGRRVGHGMAAMNGVPLGTRWRVVGGPRDGDVFEVTDRIGHGTDFDIWFPTCSEAIQYGRRAVTVELVG